MSLSSVTLHDKQFGPYLSAEKIAATIRELATRLNQDYAGRCPIFVAVLNGSFMFASDLLKEVSTECEISFIRFASYAGTSSTGDVKEIMGLREEIAGREVVIIEDIIDTGHTMHALLAAFAAKNPASVEVVTLFMKPDCLQYELPIRYVGLSIPNDFIVGYGLDYDGLGRNLPDVYKVM